MQAMQPFGAPPNGLGGQMVNGQLGLGPKVLGSAPIEGVGGNWRCTSCANVNFSKREHCNRCQAGRPPINHILAREQELEQERAVAAASGATLMQAQVGLPGRPKFQPPVAGIDGNWECLTCMSVNFASRELCHRCSAGRPPQEHIKRRAEQIKTERAVQLTTTNTFPPTSGLGTTGLGGAAGLGAGGLGGAGAGLGANGTGGLAAGGLAGNGLGGNGLAGGLPNLAGGSVSVLETADEESP